MLNNFIKGCVVGFGATIYALGLSNVAFADTIPVFTPSAGTPVHYNWGWGSPKAGIPADNFIAEFNQSGNYSSGDYFIQTFADDGVKVDVDGKTLINRWTSYSGNVDRSFWLGVSNGQHTIKTHYLENVATAAVFSDVVPFGSWLAYYYPNQNLEGMPTDAKVIQTGDSGKLYEDFGWGSPTAKISSDHFSARYSTAKRISAGDYIIRAKADDGVRVYVDGKLLINRWSDSGGYREDAIKLKIADRADAQTAEQDIHWIDVEYFDSVAVGKVEVDIDPFKSEYENSWVGEIFPNKDLSGVPYILGGKDSLNPIRSINFDWGWGNGSPIASIPGDGFSARYTKKVNLTSGTYLFTANADDGIRVKLDNQTIIDAWPNAGFKDQSKQVNVDGGEHTITVEYFEDVGLATLSFDYNLYTQLPTKVGKEVHYNWGWGSPENGAPADYFTADFDQSGTYSGDYFVQAFADDGLKIQVDGRTLINRMGDYNGKIDKALWLGVNNGQHTVKTHYVENVATASVFSDIVPLGSWLAYYYPNQNLEGMPSAAKVIQPGDSGKLSEEYGRDSPAPILNSTHFSARYSTAKHIAAGDYILRAKADDGIRVYVDGKLQIDRWSDSGYREDAIKLSIADRTDTNAGEQDVHWIEVEHYNSTTSAKVDVELETFKSEYESSWVGEIFPNKNLSGTPYIMGGKDSLNPIQSINFNWGWGNGSPMASIPGDGFSARYTKKVNLATGTYLFTANADDGIRVKLDNQTVIDAWPNASFQDQKKQIAVIGGEHTITIEYFEDVGLAKLSFDYHLYSQLPAFDGKEVHYNWGWGSPEKGAPADYFTADFDQSGTYSGDYFVQAFADDGLKIEADGQTLINRMGDYNGKIDKTLWLGVNNGQHTIKTQYFENEATAAVFSDIVPLGSWLAYYYPNQNLEGMPTAAKVIQPGDSGNLSEDFGRDSPAPNISSDHFSVRYSTAKHIAAGDYVLRTKADDGIRVYVDGKLQIDRWSDSGYREDATKLTIADRINAKAGEQDVHWVEVEYYDSIANAKVEVDLQPFTSEYENTWIGEIYPTQDLSGNPFIVGGITSMNPVNDVNFNWGASSPLQSVPVDHFSARFIKKQKFESGTYLFVSNANDGVRVLLDNQPIINDWPNTSLKEDRKAVYIEGGEHTLTVEYFDDIAWANLSFDIQKLSSNRIFYEQQRDVQYNWGFGAPTGFPADGFEAAFDQSGNYSSGDYFVQTFADDGVKVNVDGNSLINRWTDYSGTVDRALWLGVSEGNHSIITQYYDNVYSAGVFSNVIPFDSWLAYYFPNETLSGMPAASKVITPTGQYKGLTEDFQYSSPAAGMGNDNFSARYSTAKRISEGDYLLTAGADDGVRVYVDGKLVLDRWSIGAYSEDSIRLKITDRSNVPPGQQNIHWIDVEYHDSTSLGKVYFTLEPLVGPIYTTTNYNYTLSQVLDLQMATLPQTDLHDKYLREDALTKDSNGNWIVNGSGWNVRGGPGTTYPIVGTLNAGSRVNILNTIVTPGQPKWYRVSAWINAIRSDVDKYLNPLNFAKDTSEYFQFLKLSEPAGLNADEVNQKILSGKGILQDKGSSFIQAAYQYGINDVYLISHAMLETGNGTSRLANGISVNGKTVYNMYGIGAIDSDPINSGAQYAYNAGWFTPETAIIEGAQFIANNYINNGQDTLYKMRWNPASPGKHQYASDIGWAVKQINSIKNLYDQLSNYVLVFDEPKYQ